MKTTYLIVQRASEWHLLVEGRESSMLRCDERELLLEAVRQIAHRCNLEVKVYDAVGRLEQSLAPGSTDGDSDARFESPSGTRAGRLDDGDMSDRRSACGNFP